MRQKTGVITAFAFLLTIAIIMAFFYFNGKTDGVPGITQAIADIITTVAVIYGFVKVNNWKKDKERELLYAKCNELHSALCSFSVFIQLTTNLIYGKDALYRMQYSEGDELIRTQLNLEVYKETQAQLMDLMCRLQLYFQLRDNVREAYRVQMAYLIVIYTGFCRGLYQPIGEKQINFLISQTQNKLKSAEYASSMSVIINAKIDDLFNLDC
ncbi:hypothetical protein ACSC89_003402 [Salmonella enterica subsp. enterica]|nr:hypothetical protein [Salmonella enterica subsp. enterica serovar Westhampton]EEH9715108.1 hypothetical protein [Salmonella enterica subsp. enterica serovar Vancouver]